MTIGFRLYDALRRIFCLFFLVLGFEAFSSASTAHAEPNHAALEAVDDTEHLALMDEFIGLARRGDLPRDAAHKAAETLGVDPNKPDPMSG